MNQETVVAAKKLLNGDRLKSHVTFDDSICGISIYGKCPVCGEEGNHPFVNESREYVCYCPNTGAKIYAAYAEWREV